MIKLNTKITTKLTKRVKRLFGKFTADEWLRKNFEYVLNKYAGGYIVIIDNKGIVYTDKDGSPRELGLRVKKEYPGTSPLFFEVPHPDILSRCVLLGS